MPKPNNRQQPRGGQPSGPTQPIARPVLIPTNPLPGWKAILQALVLLGVPIALLLIAKVILRTFFPQLGY